MLVIGAIVLCMALFTASTMEDYDKGNGLFENYEIQSSHVITLDMFALNIYELQFLPTYFDIPSTISSIGETCI